VRSDFIGYLGEALCIPGVYAGMVDRFPIGALMANDSFVASDQTYVQTLPQQAARCPGGETGLRRGAFRATD